MELGIQGWLQVFQHIAFTSGDFYVAFYLGADDRLEAGVSLEFDGNGNCLWQLFMNYNHTGQDSTIPAPFTCGSTIQVSLTFGKGGSTISSPGIQSLNAPAVGPTFAKMAFSAEWGYGATPVAHTLAIWNEMQLQVGSKWVDWTQTKFTTGPIQLQGFLSSPSKNEVPLSPTNNGDYSQVSLDLPGSQAVPAFTAALRPANATSCPCSSKGGSTTTTASGQD